jgi:AcrR family transcriptional regulator
MARRKPDRRVERTRQQLHATLLHLVERRAYARITVGDITRRANVGRSTFYAHYRSKEDLLFRAFEGGLRALAALPAPGCSPGPARFHFSLPLLRHFGEQRRFALATLVDDGSPRVRRKTTEVLTGVVGLELDRAGAARAGRPAGALRDARAAAIVGAFLGLVQWWLRDGVRQSPEAIDAVFQRVAAALRERTAGQLT